MKETKEKRETRVIVRMIMQHIWAVHKNDREMSSPPRIQRKLKVIRESETS